MLYLFDMDGTLVRSFMRDEGGGAIQAYDKIEVLPRRQAKIAGLARNPGARFGIVTNQGGVAMGYQTVDQVFEKLGRVVAAFYGFYGRPVSLHVCFTHPKAKDLAFRVDDGRRKPGAGMLVEAMERHRADTATTWFVGDMDVDRFAAHAAGVTYYDQEEFFS